MVTICVIVMNLNDYFNSLYLCGFSSRTWEGIGLIEDDPVSLQQAML